MSLALPAAGDDDGSSMHSYRTGQSSARRSMSQHLGYSSAGDASLDISQRKAAAFAMLSEAKRRMKTFSEFHDSELSTKILSCLRSYMVNIIRTVRIARQVNTLRTLYGLGSMIHDPKAQQQAAQQSALLLTNNNAATASAGTAPGGAVASSLLDRPSTSDGSSRGGDPATAAATVSMDPAQRAELEDLERQLVEGEEVCQGCLRQLALHYAVLISRYADYRHPRQEELFFESFYEYALNFCKKAADAKNWKLVEIELNRVFRTSHFCTRSKTAAHRQKDVFLKSQDIYRLKTELRISNARKSTFAPYGVVDIPDEKVHMLEACASTTPLICSLFPEILETKAMTDRTTARTLPGASSRSQSAMKMRSPASGSPGAAAASKDGGGGRSPTAVFSQLFSPAGQPNTGPVAAVPSLALDLLSLSTVAGVLDDGNSSSAPSSHPPSTRASSRIMSARVSISTAAGQPPPPSSGQ